MPQLIIPEDGMSESQYKALELYCAGKKDNEICEEVGITKETLKRWIANNPKFRSMLRQYMSASMTINNTRLSSLYEKNIDRLERLSDRDDLDVKTELNMIKTINSMVRSAHDMEQPDTDVTITETQTTKMDEKKNVLSVEQQLNVMQRIKGSVNH